MRWVIIFLMIGLIMMVEVEAEILDSRTERDCNSTNCKWIQYSDKKFDYVNDTWVTFDYMLENAIITEDKSIRYEFRGGSYYVEFQPFGYYNGNKYYLKDLSPNIQNQINYNAFFTRARDDVKFAFSFNKLQLLEKIGLKLDTNIPISVNVYNYTPSNIYELDINNELPIYEVVDVIFVNKYMLSFVDLIENGFNLSFDISQKEMTIDLTNSNGFIEIDPISTFYSKSNDGHLIMTEQPTTCTGASSAGTVAQIGDDHLFFPAVFTEAFTEFNTSSIPDDATINDVDLSLYAHLFARKGRPLPVVNWIVAYYSNKISLGTLDCTDRNFQIWTSGEGSLDWGGTTGSKTQSIKVDSINLTGSTSFKMGNTWEHLPTGKSAITQFRTSEYTGVSSDPKLVIDYTEAEEEEEEDFRPKQKKQVFPMVLLVAMIVVATADTKRRNESEEE